MKLGVCIEVSSRARAADIHRALQRANIEFINIGMTDDEKEPELTYIETGLISALFLNLGIVDMVIGGCGTGQGYFNSVMQYPGIFAGLILDPVDAFLFSQINAGNVVSLALNKGYGTFGADINLDYIFEKLFCKPCGSGYPEHRAISQNISRKKLCDISNLTHIAMCDIIERLDPTILMRCLNFPGIIPAIERAEESKLKKSIINFYHKNL